MPYCMCFDTYSLTLSRTHAAHTDTRKGENDTHINKYKCIRSLTHMHDDEKVML